MLQLVYRVYSPKVASMSSASIIQAMQETIAKGPLNTNSLRPSARSFNSWDSERFSSRQIPRIEPTIDTFTMGPVLEAQVRRPSAVSIRVDEAPPTATNANSDTLFISPVYRLGWRSYVQIWAALATTTTLIIASNNLYARLHGKSA